MAIDPQWVSAGASVVSAIGLILVAWQAIVGAKQLGVAIRQFELAAKQLELAANQLDEFRKQIAADHERSRRERAIDVLSDWTKSLDKAQPSARSLVDTFSLEQCTKLREKKPIRIPIEQRKMLETALQGTDSLHELEEDGKELLLNEKHTSQLFYTVITHLNSIEVTLQNWLTGVADHEIIENEMQYLINPEKGRFILENFRRVAGDRKVYPAIAEFVSRIQDKNNQHTMRPRQPIA